MPGMIDCERRRAGRLAMLALLLSAPFATAAAAAVSAGQRAPRGGGVAAAAEAGRLSLALPAGGRVRVENWRGGVEIEVWDGESVELSVVGDEGKRPPRRRSPVSKSPVRVERTDALLSIGVPRLAAAAAGPPVDLRLRVPARARLHVLTSEGAVVSRGVPGGGLAAQTISGDVRLGLEAPADADITAQSLNGSIALGEGLDARGGARVVRGKFQARWGAGRRSVNLFSGRGRISLDALTADAARASAPEAAAPAERAPRFNSGGGEAASARPARTPPAPAADEPQEVGEDEVVRVESDLVTLNVSVVDRASGRGLKGLGREDFRLSEDQAEQQIQHFETADAPFDLLLLIDLSGSTAKVTDLIRAAALRFVGATRPQDRVGVVAFAGAPEVVSPLTTDRQALGAAIRVMASPKGDTRLHDALAFAMDYLQKGASNSRRRAIVLMSDGLDSTLPNVTGVGSTLPYEELRDRVQEYDGVLYTIWTSTEYEAFSPEDIQPETFDLADARMRELAEAGGGVSYDVERLEDLAGAYERVIADLGTVYSLSYSPTNKTRDGRWRTIRVRLPRHPDAVARGKRGYHAN